MSVGEPEHIKHTLEIIRRNNETIVFENIFSKSLKGLDDG